MAGTAELPRKKPLLAHILYLEGVLTGDRLDQALRAWNWHRQGGYPRAFGQVVLEQGLLPVASLARYVSLQRKLAAVPSARKPLGLVALERGVLKPAELVSLLDEQRHSRQRLGELMVRSGKLKRPQLDVLLMYQQQA
ncbi:MAG: hypothetical protein VKP62_09540 [Candidatus Sericytochromatia bacterium]|nr:hypothetical protein [Candidatus Sericytochromatia bacterium]